MRQRFFQRLVAVLVFNVFADDRDMNFVLGVLHPLDQFSPPAQVGFRRFLVQVLQDQRIHPLLREPQRHLVNGRDGDGPDDGALFHVAEGGDLLLHLAADGPVGAAQQDVGLDADRKQFLD